MMIRCMNDWNNDVVNVEHRIENDKLLTIDVFHFVSLAMLK